MLSYNAVCHKYFWDGREVPSVTTILSRLVNYKHVTNYDREFGTLVHKYTEYLDLCLMKLDDFRAPMLARMQAWEAFKKDFNIRFFKKQIEVRLYHRLYGYAGTCDRVWPGLVIDIKTGELTDVHGLQMAAYAEAHAQLTGNMVKMRMGVQLRDDGTYRVRKYVGSSDFRKFLSELSKYKRRCEYASCIGA